MSEMRELYDAIDRATVALAKAVVTVQDGTNEGATFASTSITLPDRVFGYLTNQMAFLQAEWAKNTMFNALSGELMFNGIRITRGKRN
jgi:hypothetical protein